MVWRRRWGHAAHSRNTKGDTLAGTRVVSLASHTVRCVPSAPSLAHDLTCKHSVHGTCVAAACAAQALVSLPQKARASS